MLAVTLDASCLVGRAAEQKVVTKIVDGLVSGAGNLLVIDGEAGIGKTALLDGVAAEAEAEGVIVLRARASEQDRFRPFAPLLDALSHLPAPLIETLHRAQAAEPRDRVSPLQTAPEQRTAVVDALVDVLDNLAAETPTALLVDDLHVADPGTIATIGRVAAIAGRAPFVVALARRPAPTAPELAALLGLMAQAGAFSLSLAGLHDDDLPDLLRGVTGLEPSETLLRLARRGAGNPFLVGEMVAALETTGGLVTGGGTVGVRDDLDPGAVAAGARDSVLTRFATLGEETTAVVRTAAVLGASFTVDELAVVLDRPVALLIEPLDGAARAGMIEASGAEWRFRHDLLHEAIASTVSGPAAGPLHLDMARRLTQAGAPPDRVVPHYLLGARLGDADAVATIRAAAAAIAGQAPDSAARLLERALELAPRTDPTADLVTVELVEALMWSGDFEAAIRVAEQSLSRPISEELATRLHESAARALTAIGRPAEAVEHANASGIGERAAWGTALAGVFRMFALDLDGAQRDAARALELEAMSPDPWAAALSHIVSGGVDNARGYFARAVEQFDRAVEVADTSPGRAVHRLVPHVFRALALINASRTEDAMVTIREGRKMAELLHSAWATPFFHYAEAQAHWTDGRLEDLLAECDAGLQCAADHDAWLAAPYAYAVSAAANLFLGRFEEAGRRLDEGEDRLGRTGIQYGLEWLVWIRGLHLEAVATPEDAIAMIEVGWDTAQGLQASAALSLFGPDLVRLHFLSGDLESARAVLDTLAAGESEGERHAVDVLIERCRGLLDDEPERIESAQATHAAQGRTLESVLDAEALALLHLRRSGASAGDPVQACLDQADEHGYVWIAERVRRAATASGLARRRRVSRPVHGWESLTKSEWRIARLVGEGLTNPQIAEELVLSRRTVETHLSRIYPKIAVGNRTELALSLREREADG